MLKLYGNGGGSQYTVDKLGTPVVTGITFWHVLEHMPTVSLAKEIWKSAAGVASHFASFRGPVFDDADVFDQVEPKGMHRFFENWRGHPCHFTSSDLKEAMLSDTKKKPTAHIILIHKPITSSASNVILPPGAAVDSHHYNEKEHGPKRIVEFPKVLYEEMRACAFYGPSLDDSKLDEQMDEQLLYSAFCFVDALDAKDSPKIVSCVAEGNLTGEECKAFLKKQALSIIAKAQRLQK